MVLVSKLRGPHATVDKQASNANSFLGKLRSTFARSASSPSLLGGAPTAVKVGQANCARNMSCVEKFDDGRSSDTSAGKASPTSSSSCASASPDASMVMLSDFEAKKMQASAASAIKSCKQGAIKKCKQRGGQLSICGSDCREGDSTADEALPPAETIVEPESSLRGPVVEMEFAGEAVPCSILGHAPTPLRPAPQVVGQGELPGRLWDPADPPAKATAAWNIRRDKEAFGTQGQKTRFPARLPPLGGLPPLASFSSKTLRDCCRKATPVMEVSYLPEASSPLVDLRAQ